MTNPDGTPDAPLTLTHARLRAAQGDVEAARRILRALLETDPANPDASGLLRALGGGGGGPPRSGLHREGGGRGTGLREWLDTIKKRRGPRRDAR